MRTFIMLVCLTLTTLFGAGVAEAKKKAAPTPAFPGVEAVVVNDATSALERIVVTQSKAAVTKAKGRALAQPVVGLFRADGFVVDGTVTVTFMPARRATPDRWKIVAKKVGAGKDTFSLIGFVNTGSSTGTATVKSRRAGVKKTSTQKGVSFTLALTSDNPRPARLDRGVFVNLGKFAGATLSTGTEVRLMDDGRSFVISGRQTFLTDGTPSNYRPNAWIVEVSDNGAITVHPCPLWQEGGSVEGEARCVGPNGDIGGASRTANASPDVESGMPCLWVRDGLSFDPREIFDTPTGGVGDSGAVEAIGVSGFAGDEGHPFEGSLVSAPVLKSQEVGGIFDCSSGGAVQVGSMGGAPVRWFGDSYVRLQSPDNFAVAFGCSPSGGVASGWSSRDANVCLWDARGRVSYLTRSRARLSGIAWVVADSGESWGVSFFDSSRGVDRQENPSSAVIKPVGTNEVLTWTEWLDNLAGRGVEWAVGYEPSQTGNVPTAFKGGDTRRTAWGTALTGWTEEGDAFLLWVPNPAK